MTQVVRSGVRVVIALPRPLFAIVSSLLKLKKRGFVFYFSCKSCVCLLFTFWGSCVKPRVNYLTVKERSTKLPFLSRWIWMWGQNWWNWRLSTAWSSSRSMQILERQSVRDLSQWYVHMYFASICWQLSSMWWCQSLAMQWWVVHWKIQDQWWSRRLSWPEWWGFRYTYTFNLDFETFSVCFF